MSANDRQVGGAHYQQTDSLQHWDIVDMFNLDYFQGQITKYVMRWRHKGGVQDLEKAMHFLEKYIELQKYYESQTQAVKAGALPRDFAVKPLHGEEPQGKGYVDQD